MCLNPIRVPKISGEAALIPCGKCAECMKSKANELTVRAVREAEYLNNFYFTTVTYDNDHVPLQVTECYAEPDSGDSVLCSYVCEDDSIRNAFFTNATYSWVTNKDGKPSKRYEPYKFFSDITDDGEYFKLVYYTVNNEDFKKFMKRGRISYERQFGKKLPKFKYLAVPEYGGVTYRPHFHILWFGLDRDQINFMMSHWKNGSVADIQQVKYTVSDMGAVAHYVAKYANKGSAECPYVEKALCVKPRKCFSFHFGIGNEEELLRREDYWKCKDVYGDYDINDLSTFDDDTKKKLVEDVSARRYYDLCGFKYPIPQYLKKRMFYVVRDQKILDKMRKYKPNGDLTYEEKQAFCRAFKCYTIRHTYDRESGELKYRVCTPSATAKVASELQQMVTFALLEHLRSDLHKRVERETIADFRRAEQAALEFGSQDTYEIIEQVSVSYEMAQQKKRETAELHLLNEVHRSIY